VNRYLDSAGRADRLSGGARRVPVRTPSGTFSVWTKRTGNNPDLKVLLLHGGPGSTHEYLEACDSFLPAAGVEFYYYDQLGSGHSDQPDDPSLWELDRFVDEVEQVRQALDLHRGNFVLYGQSWGGLLAMEYALAHADRLRGLVISNMMAQGPSELGMSAEAKLATWDRFGDLATIEVPTLVIGARYDTMDPDHMAEMARRLPRGSYLYCPEGSHLAMYDDQETYFEGLLSFLADLP
jgi:proline iminopeptidase